MKKKKYKKHSIGILYIKNSKNKSNKHVKRGRKGKDCIYFNENKLTCSNKNHYRYNNFCVSDDCLSFKQKLSPYDDTYIPLPNKSSIHESDNRFIGMSKNIGTPVHGEYLKSDGYRRHKARCIYYNKKTKSCTWFSHKCIGSSHCNKYQEY